MIIARTCYQKVETEWLAQFVISRDELKQAGLNRRAVRGLLQYLEVDIPKLSRGEKWRWSVRVMADRTGGCIVETRYQEKRVTVKADEGFVPPAESEEVF